jgi:outer membrane protein OmpA-like peptidoglycan-associated protein
MLSILPFYLVVNYSMATDCEQIKKDIHGERSLLRKKRMLNQALATCPEDPELHYICAYTAERLRKYEKALAHYIQTTELDPANAKGFFGLGDIYMILGSPDRAISSYKQGLSLQPDNSRIEKRLELAVIKSKSQSGEQISEEEFIQVMKEGKNKVTREGGLDGPILRMQIQFLISSSQFTTKARSQLNLVGKALENPALKSFKFEIAGHTDDLGSYDVNMELSKQRSIAVKRYLVENFAISPDNLKVVYYGSSRPAVPNSSSRNRAINRRVEFKRLNE